MLLILSWSINHQLLDSQVVDRVETTVECIVREYVCFLYTFRQNPKCDFLRFLKCHVKKRENVIQVFTLLHFEIVNTFAVKQYTQH